MTWEHVAEPTRRVVEKLAMVDEIGRLEQEVSMLRAVVASQNATIEALRKQVERIPVSLPYVSIQHSRAGE